MIDNIITYNINGKNKLYVNDTDANFSIMANIPIEKLNKINRVCCSIISIPKTFYNIVNFYFTLYENDTPINIYLNDGGYDLKQLFLSLQNILNGSTLHNVTYNIGEENNIYRTGKLLIGSTENTITKKLMFYDNNDVGFILGFHNDIMYEFTNFIISTDTINLNPDSNIYLNSNICKNYNIDNNIQSSNILCSIYSSTTKFYGYIVQKYDILTNMKDFIQQSIFKFWLSNERGHILNLNGVNITFEIKLFRYTDNFLFYKKIGNIIDYFMVNDYIKNNNND